MQVKVGWINGDYEQEGRRLRDEKLGVVKVEREIVLGTGRQRESVLVGGGVRGWEKPGGGEGLVGERFAV